MSIILCYFILITMSSRVDALKNAGVVKKNKKNKKNIYETEIRICEKGTLRQLRHLYDTNALSLKYDKALIEYHSTHGCSQCKYEKQLGTCHCNKTCCSICIGMCVFCNRIRHIQFVSNTDAIRVITSVLRTFLLQVYALQLALVPNANEVLKKNWIVAMLHVHSCFTELDIRGVDITP